MRPGGIGINADTDNPTWSGREKPLPLKRKGREKVGYQCRADVMFGAGEPERK